VVGIMLAIGLQVTGGQLLALTRQSALLGRALLANLVLVPLLALLVTNVLTLPEAVAAGIMLVAVAPGGLGALQFTAHAPTSLALAGTLTVFLGLLSIVFTPVAARVMLPSLSMSLPYGPTLRAVVLYLLLPLVVGAVIRVQAPHLARALVKPVTVIASVSFIAVVLLTLGLRSQMTGSIGVVGAIAILATIVGAMAIGWWLGGPSAETRSVLASATSVRNVALALFVTLQNAVDAQLTVTVAAFGALMVPPNLVFNLSRQFVARRHRERPASRQERAA
jgi:BASS family bile acid:Na+ symporter